MRKAIDVFGEWAEKGKDQGMEESHAIPVDEMMNFALKERLEIGKKFSFLDLGCGNGWVVRKVANNTLCNLSVGIDGAQQMISNAELRGGDTKYILANINSFNSPEKYDVIHSMEVLYYLDDPSEIVRKISDSWLNKNGRLIVGIDHYYENTDSHSWQEKVGTRMLMLREIEWIQIFEDAGLSEVESWHSNKHTDWAGTLVITGKKQII
ncbi:MAG TPA: class I SAM-dependent methyltransferase [Marine Group III euryarchaeote]|uniref:Class I SAM-dependent methyltransferase n=1 Tax=Marine Group III euryarchaeote TaxID=2173149 RepID=A0A7J4GRP5_9ARCH|nr:class I SAM-dependent methyltransferase [Marine Group III euryarchaeote]